MGHNVGVETPNWEALHLNKKTTPNRRRITKMTTWSIGFNHKPI
jgi:hypothetical protein